MTPKKIMISLFTRTLLLLMVPSVVFISCDTNHIILEPKYGYGWKTVERPYWPTQAWQTAPMDEHDISAEKMRIADEFAANDQYARALLVVKDGYLVFEKYYGDGGVDQSTNLWSVTKSFSSALVGILMDEYFVSSTNQRMADLMPDYPEFQDITLHHALTHTTGLDWQETGLPWVQWVFSPDWVTSALARGQDHRPGKKFKYSSGNSHFLTSLVQTKTGIAPGMLAKEHLFDPMGIPFTILDLPITYYNWDDYKRPLHQTWRKDTKGIETAGFGLYLTARHMAKLGYLYLNKGRWEDQQLLSESWVESSVREYQTNIYDRYSYGYQWWITSIAGYPSFLASGWGGQIIGIVPSLDLVVVLKYEAEGAVDPVSGTAHDDIRLFELVVEAVNQD
ncbi:MAG: beta-lactamase family protein [Bacteroidia bacterium]|nr:beta-lactamase family protein [Bacteroidia bacterium]